eukprot:Rhum_TRINITY_DN15145_c7_g2::Rhum_TRINITY_DN15145_c7_g2_i1::g.138717::m.138717
MLQRCRLVSASVSALTGTVRSDAAVARDTAYFESAIAGQTLTSQAAKSFFDAADGAGIAPHKALRLYRAGGGGAAASGGTEHVRRCLTWLLRQRSTVQRRLAGRAKAEHQRATSKLAVEGVTVVRWAEKAGGGALDLACVGMALQLQIGDTSTDAVRRTLYLFGVALRVCPPERQRGRALRDAAELVARHVGSEGTQATLHDVLLRLTAAGVACTPSILGSMLHECSRRGDAAAARVWWRFGVSHVDGWPPTGVRSGGPGVLHFLESLGAYEEAAAAAATVFGGGGGAAGYPAWCRRVLLRAARGDVEAAERLSAGLPGTEEVEGRLMALGYAGQPTLLVERYEAAAALPDGRRSRTLHPTVVRALAASVLYQRPSLQALLSEAQGTVGDREALRREALAVLPAFREASAAAGAPSWVGVCMRLLLEGAAGTGGGADQAETAGTALAQVHQEYQRWVLVARRAAAVLGGESHLLLAALAERIEALPASISRPPRRHSPHGDFLHWLGYPGYTSNAAAAEETVASVVGGGAAAEQLRRRRRQPQRASPFARSALAALAGDPLPVPAPAVLRGRPAPPDAVSAREAVVAAPAQSPVLVPVPPPQPAAAAAVAPPPQPPPPPPPASSVSEEEAWQEVLRMLRRKRHAKRAATRQAALLSFYTRQFSSAAASASAVVDGEAAAQQQQRRRFGRLLLAEMATDREAGRLRADTALHTAVLQMLRGSDWDGFFYVLEKTAAAAAAGSDGGGSGEGSVDEKLASVALSGCAQHLRAVGGRGCELRLALWVWVQAPSPKGFRLYTRLMEVLGLLGEVERAETLLLEAPPVPSLGYVLCPYLVEHFEHVYAVRGVSHDDAVRRIRALMLSGKPLKGGSTT